LRGSAHRPQSRVHVTLPRLCRSVSLTTNMASFVKGRRLMLRSVDNSWSYPMTRSLFLDVRCTYRQSFSGPPALASRPTFIAWHYSQYIKLEIRGFSAFYGRFNGPRKLSLFALHASRAQYSPHTRKGSDFIWAMSSAEVSRQRSSRSADRCIGATLYAAHLSLLILVVPHVYSRITRRILPYVIRLLHNLYRRIVDRQVHESRLSTRVQDA
jgi:hypothetical protein